MSTRSERERTFHDRYYHERSRDSRPGEPAQDVLDSFLEHAVAALGNVDGRRVLDCGAGDGEMSLWLARRSARVDAVDISFEALVLARGRTVAAGLADRVQLTQCSLELLPFATGSMDLVFGSLILHHVDVARAAGEIARVLKPGAVAAFSENFAFNPILRFARNHVVGRFGIPRLGTPTEQPLHASDIDQLSEWFDVELAWPEFLFFRLLDRQVFGYQRAWVNRACAALDRWVYRHLEFLRGYSYRGTLILRRR